jgi:hypothetical protein
MAEKADPRLGASDRLGESFSLAPVPTADGAVLASPGELDAGRSIVQEKHVNIPVTAQALAFIMGEMTPGQPCRSTDRRS